MAFDGDSVALIIGRGFKMLKGKRPFSMQPIRMTDDRGNYALAGDVVEFVHEGEAHEFEPTEGSGIDVATLKTYTAGRTWVGALFLYRRRIWQVAVYEPDGQEGTDWPCYVELTGHAMGAKEGGGG